MAYPNTFLDDLTIYNAKAAVVIKNLSLEGRTEEAILLSTLKSTANDITLTDDVRLNALTALINQGKLLDYALAPYFPSIITYKNSQTYVGLHNDLSGLNTGDYYHLTYTEYLKLVNLPDGLNVDFGDITGPVSGNTNLQNALNAKQDLIVTGSSNRFFAWDKTWKDLDYSYITNKPSTLSGLGISASDTLFDGKYVLQSSIMTSYTLGSNAPISNTDSLVASLGKIQAQISALTASSGTLSTVGITTPVGFFLTVGNTPLTGSGGDIALNLASQSQNTIFAAPDGSNGVPSFRSLSAQDLPLSGISAGTYGDASNYPIIQVDSYGRLTSVSLQPASGTGTVQSVDVTMPSEFAFTGGPVTTIGSIDFTWNNQTAGKVLASPETTTGTPAFRALVASDIPDISISQVTNLQAALNNNANLNTLPNAQIFIGNPSSKPQPRAISGVITIDNEGTTYPVNNSIPLTALEHINDFTLLGRLDAPFGEVQVVGLSTTDFVIDIYGNLSLANPVAPSITAPGQLLSYNAAGTPPGQAALPAPSEGQILVGYPTRPAPDEFGLIWVTPSGVIDTIGTDGTVSLANNSIDYNKLKDAVAANILLGRGNTVGEIEALDSATATSILDSFAGTSKGLVPGGSGGDATKFLAGDGTWMQPSGSGTVISSTGGQVAVYSGGAGSTSVAGLAFAGAGLYLKTNATNDGVEWATAASGVNSGTQYQLAYYASTGSTVSGLTIPTASRALVSDANGLPTASTTTTTQLQYLSSATGTTGTTSTNLVFSDSPVLLQPEIGTGGTDSHIHFRKAASAVGKNNYATLFFQESGSIRRMSVIWDNDGYQSEFKFDAASTTKTYTFPNATGTVALIDSTQLLSVAASGGNSGKIALGGSTSGTITLQAPATITGAGTYTMPDAYPAAASGYYLTSDLSGVLTWDSVTGGGDVTGPTGPVADKNFAVFDGTTGKIIMEPSNASLSAAGRAVFNDGVDVGISSSTTGTLVFRSSVNAFTTTIRQGTATQSNTYTWPTGTLTAGYILSTDASGNLSWTAAGAGDMVLASTQTNTGAKTFNNNTLLLRNSGNTFSTTLSAGATGANYVATFPAATGTVAMVGFAQTFTALQTFSTGLTVSGATSAIMSTVGSTTVPQLSIAGGAGTTMNWINIAQAGAANPVTGLTPAIGTKIRFRAATNTSTLDTGMGLDANSNFYFSTGTQGTQADNRFSFYMPVSTTATEVVRITQNGIALGEILSTPAAGRTGALLVLSNQVTTASPSYIRFDGFPGGTVTPNSAGGTPTGRLGSGSRLVFYIPGGASAYPTAMGYHNSGGIFAAMAVATQFSIFGDAVESFRMTASNNTSTSATISLVNSAGVLNQVLTSRITGYGSPTNGNRANSWDSSVITATDANIRLVAGSLAGLIADLKTHGLIG
jgi:hypothetical protein